MLNYDYDHGFNEPNSKNAWFGALIGSHKRVLEVGCATGYVGEYLANEAGCSVTGVELVQVAAKKALARQCYEHIYVGDVQDPWLLNGEGSKFDFVLFGDVLEHLVDPASVLHHVSEHLEFDGHILVCVPNVAHWSTRLRLLLGQFDYTETGTLDRTHLRYFTRRGAISMVEQAGLKVNILTGVVWLPFPFNRFPQSIRQHIERFTAFVLPKLFWGQILIDVVSCDSRVPSELH